MHRTTVYYSSVVIGIAKRGWRQVSNGDERKDVLDCYHYTNCRPSEIMTSPATSNQYTS